MNNIFKPTLQNPCGHNNGVSFIKNSDGLRPTMLWFKRWVRNVSITRFNGLYRIWVSVFHHGNHFGCIYYDEPFHRSRFKRGGRYRIGQFLTRGDVLKKKGSDFRYLYSRRPSRQPRLQNSSWTILPNIPFGDIKVKTK